MGKLRLKNAFLPPESFIPRTTHHRSSCFMRLHFNKSESSSAIKCCCLPTDIENLQTICYIIKRATVNFYCRSELLLSFIVSTSLYPGRQQKVLGTTKNIQILTFIEFNETSGKWWFYASIIDFRSGSRFDMLEIWFLKYLAKENSHRKTAAIETVKYNTRPPPIKATLKFNAFRFGGTISQESA